MLSLALQAAVTRLRNDAVVVPLNQQGPINASRQAQQDADEEGLQLSSIDPDLADAAVILDSKAMEDKAGGEEQAGRGSEGKAGVGEKAWEAGKNPKGMRIEDAFRDSGPAGMGMKGAGQVRVLVHHMWSICWALQCLNCAWAIVQQAT